MLIHSLSDVIQLAAHKEDPHLRKKYDVRTMWEDLGPQWRLLQSQLEARDLAGIHLLISRSDSSQTSPSGLVMTREALRTDGNTVAWQASNVAHDLIWQSCRPLVFSGGKEIICAMYSIEEEQVISLPYTCTPLDASMRRRKKRKQGEDNALAG